MTASNDDADKPLDPAVEAVHRKMRRLMAIAGATLGLGILAVLAAVIVRFFILGGDDTPAADIAGSIVAELPAGATILDVSLDGSRAAVLVEQGGGRRLLIYEIGTGRLVGSLDFLSR